MTVPANMRPMMFDGVWCIETHATFASQRLWEHALPLLGSCDEGPLHYHAPALRRHGSVGAPVGLQPSVGTTPQDAESPLG